MPTMLFYHDHHPRFYQFHLDQLQSGKWTLGASRGSNKAKNTWVITARGALLSSSLTPVPPSPHLISPILSPLPCPHPLTSYPIFYCPLSLWGIDAPSGVLDGASPMSHVNFKKWPCCMSLSLFSPMSYVEFKK